MPRNHTYFQNLDKLDLKKLLCGGQFLPFQIFEINLGHNLALDGTLYWRVYDPLPSEKEIYWTFIS